MVSHWHHALALYTDLGVPDADDVQTYLTALDQLSNDDNGDAAYLRGDTTGWPNRAAHYRRRMLGRAQYSEERQTEGGRLHVRAVDTHTHAAVA